MKYEKAVITQKREIVSHFGVVVWPWENLLLPVGLLLTLGLSVIKNLIINNSHFYFFTV